MIWTRFRRWRPCMRVDSIQLVESGPLRASIRVERHFGQSKFVQYLRLTAGSSRVDVDNDFDWQETHCDVEGGVPACGLVGERDLRDPVRQHSTSHDPATTRSKRQNMRFRHCAAADLGDAGHGFSLLNASKYGYDAIGNVLRLSLLRSPVYPDPTADRGRHEFRYSLYPHAGTWQQAQTVRRGYELNYTLSAVQVEAHAGSLPPVHSFVTVQGDNVVLTAIKKAEDSNALILRLYEWAGKTAPLVLNLPGTPISAEEVRHDGNRCEGTTELAWKLRHNDEQAIRNQDSANRLREHQS